MCLNWILLQDESRTIFLSLFFEKVCYEQEFNSQNFEWNELLVHEMKPIPPIGFNINKIHNLQ